MLIRGCIRFPSSLTKDARERCGYIMIPTVKGQILTLISAMINEGVFDSKITNNNTCSRVNFCSYLLSFW